jgi:hypothetical protein
MEFDLVCEMKRKERELYKSSKRDKKSGDFNYIKKDYFIYRGRNTKDDSSSLEPNLCSDTGKTGLYFSDRKKISLGMCIEYDLPIFDLYRYVVNSPIELYRGKYSFRNFNNEKYFDKNKNLILNILPSQDENISHYDLQNFPIYPNSYKHLVIHSKNEYKSFNFGEIFISSQDLNKLTYLDKETFTKDEILNGF